MITVKVICDNQGKITQNNQRKPKKIEQHTEADSKQQVVLKKQRVFVYGHHPLEDILGYTFSRLKSLLQPYGFNNGYVTQKNIWRSHKMIPGFPSSGYK